MSNDDSKGIQELFLAALELPVEQRDAWLIKQCGDDANLLSEVRALLEHDTPADDPLEKGLDEAILSGAGLLKHQEQGLHVRCPHCRNPIELVEDAKLDSVTCASCGSSFSLLAAEETKSYSPSQNERVAHFNIVDKVGAGAFGSVYRAFDETLSRTVAIKVPRKGQLNAEESEKFFREARTAAQLRHPNIVSVHEVGRDEDRIYIVSDFVDGLTLTDWLTGMQPTPRETAALVIKVARALHHAHEQGVIHRDLKPGNIMLDRDNEPHLMDFGLAKREAGEITMTMDGQVLGTPAYMSPEQARGEGHHVDRRADIYSLGVILFEMLTGERPFRGNTRMLLHQVLTEEAPSPRSLNASIPRDLDTICLKCLEKSPGKRYATASDLADDLQNHLDHKPITARPIGRVERSIRWCKRKPVVAGLSALLMLAMVCGTVVSSYFAVDANQKAGELANSLTVERQLVAEKTVLLDEKEALVSDLNVSSQKARAAADDALQKKREAENVLQFLQDHVLAAARPDGQDGGLGIDATIRDAITRAEPLIAEAFSDQPLVEATIRDTIGQSYYYLSEYQRSIESLERALVIRRAHLDADHPETLSTMTHLARVLTAADQLDKAFPLLDEALLRKQKSLGESHPDTLASMYDQAVAFRHSEQYRHAINLLQTTVALQEAELGRHHPQTLRSIREMAYAHQHLYGGEHNKAHELLKEVVSAQKKILGDNHPETIFSQILFEQSLPAAQRRSRLENILMRSNDLLGPSHPHNLLLLTRLSFHQNTIEDSLRMLNDAFEMARAKLGTQHRQWYQIAANIGYFYLKKGDDADAIAHYENVIQEWTKHAIPMNMSIAISFQNLAVAYPTENSEPTLESLELYRKAFEYKVKVGRVNSISKVKLANHLDQFGWALVALKRFEEAETVCRESFEISIKNRPQNWRRLYAQSFLGAALAGQDKFPEAEPLLIEAYQKIEKRRGEIPQNFMADLSPSTLQHIVAMYERWGREEELAVWRPKLDAIESAAEDAKRLRSEAEQLLADGKVLEALKLHESIADLPLQEADHRILRDLYARTQQWEKALAAEVAFAGRRTTWQRVALLHQLGRRADYRVSRAALLENHEQNTEAWAQHLNLVMTLLDPITKELHPAVRWLAEQNAKSQKSWERRIVGKAMYRLGDLRKWHDALPEDSELRRDHAFLRAIVAFQEQPTAENRNTLLNELGRAEKGLQNQIHDGAIHQQWQNYVEQSAWIAEAKRVLSGDLIRVDAETSFGRFDGRKLAGVFRNVDSSEIPPELVSVLGSDRLNYIRRGVGAVRFDEGAKKIRAVQQMTGIAYQFDQDTGELDALQVGVPNVLSVSDDGMLALSIQEGQVRIWETTSAKVIAQFPRSNTTVFAFSPDKRHVYCAHRDGQISARELDDPDTETEIRKADGTSIAALKLDPSRHTLIARNDKDAVIVIDVKGGELLAELQFEPDKERFWLEDLCACSNGGQRMAIGAHGRTETQVSIRDQQTGQLLWEFQPLEILKENRQLRAIALSPDGSLLVTMDIHAHVAFWNIDEKKLLGRLEHRMISGGTLQFNSPGTQLIISDERGFSVVDPATREVILQPDVLGDVNSLSVSMNGRKVYGGAQGIYKWEIPETKPVNHLAMPFYSSVYSASVDGATVWGGGHASSIDRLRLYDSQNGRVTKSILFHEDNTRGRCCVSEHGSVAAHAVAGHPITLWNLASSKKLLDISVDGKVQSMALSRDGRKLAAGLGSDAPEKKRLVVFDTRTGNTLLERDVNGTRSLRERRLTFSPNGQVIAFGHGDPKEPRWQLRRIRIEDEEELKSFGGSPELLAYSPDGRYVAYTEFGGNLYVFDTEKDHRTHTIALPSRLPAEHRNGFYGSSIAFAPDSRHVFVGNENGMVFVFRLETLVSDSSTK